MEKIDKLYDVIFSDKKVVVITGAGISTLSGIPDFRGENGLYSQGNEAAFMLSYYCFKYEQDRFYEFYKNNMIKLDVEPNIVHDVLSKLEERGLIEGIVTQNIDGLHEKAGSKKVVNLHGNGNKFYCVNCITSHTVQEYLESNRCKCCGDIVRPDIVLYGETINYEVGLKALRAIKDADKLVILGSSLSVPTINGLINVFIHNKKDFSIDDIFIINKGKTRYDNYAHTIDEDLGDVFQKILSYDK